MCLAQGHNTVTLVKLEPMAPPSFYFNVQENKMDFNVEDNSKTQIYLCFLML